MDCPNKILPLAHQHSITRCTETTTPGQALDTTEKIEAGEIGPDHSLDRADTKALAIMTCTEAAPDHNKGMGTDDIEAAHVDPIQHTKATATEPTVTHHTGHTADNPHTAAHQVTTLRTTVGQGHVHPTDSQNIFHTTEDHAVQDNTPTKDPKITP